MGSALSQPPTAAELAEGTYFHSASQDVFS